MKSGHRAFLCLAFALLTVIRPHRLLAQVSANDPVAAADAAYNAHNWAVAENLYSSLTKESPDNARFWYRLGVSQRGAVVLRPGVGVLRKSQNPGAAKGLPGYMVDYEVGTTYAAMGDSSRAIKALKDAAEGGFLSGGSRAERCRWNPLRTEPQFVALANEVKHNAAPCEDAEFRQFDFWVGDWDVISTADGVSRGSSHISKEMGGCVIWENWTSAGSSYFGKSYNTYNLNLHRWEQYWVDNSGGDDLLLRQSQRRLDGLLDRRHSAAERPEAPAPPAVLQPGAGKVRQFSQGSTDGGKTWQVEYDLTYNRHADKSAGAP